MARPELFDSHPDWGGGKLNAASTSLEPLNDDDCRRLIANLLGGDSLPDPVRDADRRAAEGNALFAEELLAMLVDDELLAWEDDAGSSPATSATCSSRTRSTRSLRLGWKACPRATDAARSGVGRGGALPLRRVPRTLAELSDSSLDRISPARPPGPDPARSLELLGRRRVPLQAHPDPRRRLPLALKDDACGPPRALRRLARTRSRDRIGEYEEIVGYHLEQAYRCRAGLRPAEELEPRGEGLSSGSIPPGAALSRAATFRQQSGCSNGLRTSCRRWAETRRCCRSSARR